MPSVAASRAAPGRLPGGAQRSRGGFPGGGFPGGGHPRRVGDGHGHGTTNGFGGGRLASAAAVGGFGRAVAGGGGGFLNASQSNPALTKLLQADAGRYTWAAATVNSNNAAGYQLASGEPIMAIGGFNGTDPAPRSPSSRSTSQRARSTTSSPAGRRGGFGGVAASAAAAAAGLGDDASQITSWVESHFTAETVGGVTIYDLTHADAPAPLGTATCATAADALGQDDAQRRGQAST